MPGRYEDRFELHLWNWLRLAWAQHGPEPDPDITRALIREMRTFSESRGAAFLLVHWRQDIEFPEGSGMRTGGGGVAVLRGMDVRLLDLGVEAPPGWDDWTISGDPHPDARAHRRAARLLFEEFGYLGLLPSEFRGEKDFEFPGRAGADFS